jgi:hypothetical protein
MPGSLDSAGSGKSRYRGLYLSHSRAIAGLQTRPEGQSISSPSPTVDRTSADKKGLVPINEPDENSPVIVTGNNQSTSEVLAAIFAQDAAPAYFLLTDCLGGTADMATLCGDFTPARLAQVMAETDPESRVKHRHR